MIGREERIAEIAARHRTTVQIVLELKNVSTSYGHTGIDLTLHKAEILGLYGLVGAGRTELARALVGGRARSPAASFAFAASRRASRDPHEALKRYRIGYVSEDRKDEGLILAHPVGANIAITIWRAHRQRLRPGHSARRDARRSGPMSSSSRSGLRRSTSWSAPSPAATSRRSRSPNGWPPKPTS